MPVPKLVKNGIYSHFARAYKLDYYNLPRKIDSKQLARKLNLKRSTLVVHRRKAELRILTKIMKG
jgi:predicted DNA binding protein